jgi:hypothetical protein
MNSEFHVQNAGYEQLMGHWSQRLARLFIDFTGVADGERILDVGCGTGSLTFALANAADLAEIVAVRLFTSLCRGGDTAQHKPANRSPTGGCLGLTQSFADYWAPIAAGEGPPKISAP